MHTYCLQVNTSLGEFAFFLVDFAALLADLVFEALDQVIVLLLPSRAVRIVEVFVTIWKVRMERHVAPAKNNRLLQASHYSQSIHRGAPEHYRLSIKVKTINN